MDFSRLKSDGETCEILPEETRVAGEELWSIPTNHSGVSVTPSTALRSSAYLSTLVVLATDVAVLSLDPYRKRPDGSRVDATDHDVYPLLCRSPNGETTPMRWRQALMGHALQHGNGYAEIQRTGRGKPYGFHLLCPETTKPIRTPAGELRYRQADGTTIPAANVIHIAGFGHDGLTGYSFTRLLSQAIGLAMAAETSAAGFFGNGSEPGGIIETPKRLDEDGAQRLARDWEMRHGGPGNRHRTAVLEDGATWKPIGSDPEKSQLLETRKFQVVDGTRPWRVPPHKLGDFSQAHLSNIDASNLDYLMTALMGWLTSIEQEFNLKVFTLAEWKAGYFVEHNVNALLRGDIKTRFESYASALDRGWMSRNEVRRRENMNPIPASEGGDKYLLQAQNVPLASAGQGVNIPGAPTTPKEAPPDA